MRRLKALTVAVGLGLIWVPLALAQGASEQGYGGAGGGVQAALGGGGAANTGSLPFTGLDILMLFAGGSAIVLVGLGLRRFARPRG
jgi:hypothetical protein